MQMPKRVLTKAAVLNPEGLRRFAKWLKLETSGMSDEQVARLVYWRINRFDYARMY